MEIHFNNLLVSLKFLDFSFSNPLELRFNEDGEIIGSAVLTKKKKKIYADIIITKRANYINCYPRVAIEAFNQRIAYVFLSEGRSIDPEVKTIKEQTMYSSA